MATTDKSPTVTVAVRVPERTRDRLNTVASARGEQMADTLRLLIERGLDMPEPVIPGKAADRRRVAVLAQYLMESLSDLISEVEASGDVEGARLLVVAVEKSCEQWRETRQLPG